MISVTDRNYKTTANVLNSKLDKFYDRLCSNKLKLNVSKTKFMIIGSRYNCVK